MNKYIRTFLAIGAFAIFMAVSYFAYNSLIVTPSASNLEPQTKSVPATDFKVFDANGEEVMLSDFYGKPIILNFWASWCTYCIEEMPYFQKAYEEYGDEIEFLMVNSTDGQRETVARAKDFIKNGGYTFPVYFDNSGDAITSYEARSLPTTVCIDKDQNVIIYQPGKMTEDMVAKAIEMLLPRN